MLNKVPIKDLKTGDLFWSSGPCMRISDPSWIAVRLDSGMRISAASFDVHKIDSKIGRDSCRFDELGLGQTFASMGCLFIVTPGEPVNLTYGTTWAFDDDRIVFPTEAELEN